MSEVVSVLESTAELDLSCVDFDVTELNELLREIGLEDTELNRKIACDALIATSLAALCKSLEIFQEQISALMEIGAFAEEEADAAVRVLDHLQSELTQELELLGDGDQTTQNLLQLKRHLFGLKPT